MGAVTDYICSRVVKLRSNCDLTLTGERGCGKSFTAAKFGELVAARFNTPFSVEGNIHFTAENFLSKVDELTRGKGQRQVMPGHVLILDEAGRGLDSQAWWEQSVKALAGELETYRTYRMVTILTTPRIGNITKRIREMTTALMKPLMPMVPDRRDLLRPTTNIDFAKKMSNWRFFLLWCDPAPTRSSSSMSFPMYRMRDARGVLDIVKVGLPNKNLLKKYEVKKRLFLDDLRGKSIRTMKGEDVKATTKKEDKKKELDAVIKKVLADKESYGYDYRGKWVIDRGILRRSLGLGYTDVEYVKGVTTRKINSSSSV